MGKKKLNLNVNWCKGCGICVEYCPKKVLGIHGDVVNIDNIDNCISCGLCELRCPDYAIYLAENEQ